MFIGTQGLIFVIDSNDRQRIEEARLELHRIILDREMKDALLLVFANKQDIPGGILEPTNSGGTLANAVAQAMTPQEVQEKLRLTQLKDKLWYVVPSCATTGEGLFDGLVRSDSTNKGNNSNTSTRAGYQTISKPNRSVPENSPRLRSTGCYVFLNVLYTMILIGYYSEGFGVAT